MAERKPRKRRALRPEDQPVIDSLYDNTGALYTNNKDEEILDKDMKDLNANLKSLIRELRISHTESQLIRTLSGKTGTGKANKEPSITDDIKKTLLSNSKDTIDQFKQNGLISLAIRTALERHNKTFMESVVSDLKRVSIQKVTGNAETRIQAFKNRGLLGYITKYMVDKKAHQQAISAFPLDENTSRPYSNTNTPVSTQTVSSKPVIENPRIDAPNFRPELPEYTTTNKPRVSFKDSKMVFNNPPEISGPNVIEKQLPIKSWNEFQKTFKNKFDDVAEASLAWKEYKNNQDNLAEKWNKPNIEILSKIDEKMGGVLEETTQTNEILKGDAFDKAEALREQKKANELRNVDTSLLSKATSAKSKSNPNIALKGLFDGLLEELTKGLSLMAPALLSAVKSGLVPVGLAVGNAAMAYLEGKDAYNLLKDAKREEEVLEGSGSASSSLSSTIATGLAFVPGGQIPAAAILAGNAANRYLIKPGNDLYFSQRSKDAGTKQNDVSNKLMADVRATKDRIEDNKKPVNLNLEDATTTEEQLIALEKFASNTSEDTQDFFKSGGRDRATAIAMTEIPFISRDMRMILKNRDVLRKRKNDAAYINLVYNNQKKLLGEATGEISRGELAQFDKQEKISGIPANINGEMLRSNIESYATFIPGMPQGYAMHGWMRDKLLGESGDVKAQTVDDYKVRVPASLDIDKKMVDIAKTNQQTSATQFMKSRLAETLNYSSKSLANNKPIIIQSNSNVNTGSTQPQTTVLTPMNHRVDDDTYMRSQNQARNARLGL